MRLEREALEADAGAGLFTETAVNLAREGVIALARKDPAIFCEYVLRDEKTHQPITLAPAHYAMHDAAQAHDRMIFWAHIESGKTNQMSIGLTLWELGHNPELRFSILGPSANAANNIVRSIATYIEESEELHQVFPELRPSTRARDPWNLRALTVQRKTRAKDPSITSAGVQTQIIGARYDRIVGDDILTYQNTANRERRVELTQWLLSTPFGRLTDDGRIRLLGNAWKADDAYHELAKNHGFSWMKVAALDAQGRPTWSERWSHKRLAKAMVDLGPLEYARQLQCKVRDDEGARFKAEWVKIAMDLGRGWRMPKEVHALRNGFAIFTGVDLAIDIAKEESDLCAFVTVLLHPNGVRQVLNVESGRFTGQEIINKIDDLDRRYGGIFIVENNAAQDFLVQFARAGTSAAIKPFRTGRNKAHPQYGIEGLATEMAGSKWLIPSTSKGVGLGRETHELVQEVLFYTPGAHSGDRLMALWFAREGIRWFERGNKRDSEEESDTGEPEDGEVDPRVSQPRSRVLEFGSTKRKDGTESGPRTGVH